MFLYVCKQTFRKRYEWITQEFLGLKIRNIQGISYIWTETYREIFKSAKRTFKCHICIFVKERKLNCVTIFLKIEIILFAVSSFPLWYSWYQRAKIALQMGLRNRKNDYHFKGLDKTTCYKTKPNFSFLIDCCMSVFSLSLSEH